MNTYYATRKELEERCNQGEYNKVLAKVLEAESKGEFISIRLEDISEDHIILYGVYTMTLEEYQDYVSAGGAWGYVPASEWLNS